MKRKSFSNKNHRRTKRPRGRTSIRSRRFKTSGRKVVTKGRGPFPKVYYTKLTYSISQLISGIGLNGANFRLNSLFDPVSAVGGGQPRYFDTLCGASGGTAPYNRYTVFGCKVSAKVFTTGPNQALVGCTAIPIGSSPPSSAEEAIERAGETRYVSLSGSTGGSSNKTFSKFYRIKDLDGVKDVKDVSGLSANYNANPIRDIQCSVWAQNPDGATTTAVTAMITLTYYVMFAAKNDVLDS